MNTSKKVRVMVEGAMLIAMGFVLSYIKFYNLPQGGAITLEMLPLVVMSLRNGSKWGLLTGFVHGLLQMILGFENVMYCNGLLAQFGCIMLDYVLAFAVLGLADVFAKPFGNKIVGAVTGAVVVGILRFVCSFLSGWLLWGSYAPEGMGAVAYSFTYNASYMIPNIIIMGVVTAILMKVAPKIMKPVE